MPKPKRHRLLVGVILVPTAILSGWLFANAHWFLAILLLMIAVIPILRRHRRRCHTCGSWRTHVEIHETTDRSDSTTLILASVRRCRACLAACLVDSGFIPGLRIQS